MPRIIDPYKELLAFVARYPTQRAAAEALQISEPYLCDLLQQHRNVSDPLLEKLGLLRVVVKA